LKLIKVIFSLTALFALILMASISGRIALADIYTTFLHEPVGVMSASSFSRVVADAISLNPWGADNWHYASLSREESDQLDDAIRKAIVSRPTWPYAWALAGKVDSSNFNSNHRFQEIRSRLAVLGPNEIAIHFYYADFAIENWYRLSAELHNIYSEDIRFLLKNRAQSKRIIEVAQKYKRERMLCRRFYDVSTYSRDVCERWAKQGRAPGYVDAGRASS
jgi:hypothetical protein